MRNTVIIIGIILIFLILYFVQVNFFNWFTISGISPNLFVIYVLFIGLFAGKKLGIPIGIVIGLSLDFFISKKVGILGIMLGIVGMVGSTLDKSFSKDSRITTIIMTIGVTIVYEIGVYLLNYIIIHSAVEIVPFLKILLIETIYNVFIVIIFYPLLQKGGHYIEEIFREKKILTRYF